VALVRDLVIAFMKGQAGAICVSCMAKALQLPLDRMMDAWADIRLRGDLPIEVGACSGRHSRPVEVIHPRL
jgi:hypothetical protein